MPASVYPGAGLWNPAVAPGRRPGTAVIGLAIMTNDEPSASDNERRVVNFRRGRTGARAPATPPPVEDLAKYERGEAPDDYRHRMIVNALALLFVIALIGAGYWLADTMARMRKNQDCVLSGRRGCTPVEVNRDRW